MTQAIEKVAAWRRSDAAPRRDPHVAEPQTTRLSRREPCDRREHDGAGNEPDARVGKRIDVGVRQREGENRIGREGEHRDRGQDGGSHRADYLVGLPDEAFSAVECIPRRRTQHFVVRRASPIPSRPAPGPDDLDRWVPIVFWWPKAPAQTRMMPVSTTDIAPTLSNRHRDPDAHDLDGQCLDLGRAGVGACARR